MNGTESNGRMSDKPRMKISENNTLVDITLNLTLVPGIWVSQPTLAHIGILYLSFVKLTLVFYILFVSRNLSPIPTSVCVGYFILMFNVFHHVT